MYMVGEKRELIIGLDWLSNIGSVKQLKCPDQE